MHATICPVVGAGCPNAQLVNVAQAQCSALHQAKSIGRVARRHGCTGKVVPGLANTSRRKRPTSGLRVCASRQALRSCSRREQFQGAFGWLSFCCLHCALLCDKSSSQGERIARCSFSSSTIAATDLRSCSMNLRTAAFIEGSRSQCADSVSCGSRPRDILCAP